MPDRFVFREGDKVLLRTSWMSSRDKIPHTIKKITKTGKIRLDDGQLFNQFGKRSEKGWGIMWLQYLPEKVP